MRIRAIVAIVLLLGPAVLNAQRVPRIGRPGVARPQPLPDRGPPAVMRELAYRRMRVSIEEYPLFSYMDASGFQGGAGSWTSLGVGTRADYRVTRFVSLTADLTSSFAASPVVANTIELGTRIHRERTESRGYPFADLRVGYMSAFASPYQSLQDMYAGPQNGYHDSQGFGVLAGIGTEYALSRRFSLTAATSVMRNRMTGYGYPSNVAQATRQTYMMTAYRFILGLRYNPVRLIRPPEYPSNNTP